MCRIFARPFQSLSQRTLLAAPLSIRKMSDGIFVEIESLLNERVAETTI
jgi:hypothetical protein